MRRLLLLLLAGLTFAPAAPADEAPAVADGPRGRFDDDLIARLAGDWRLQRQIRGTEVRNVVHADWVLNHQFLEVRMKDVAEPSRYEAIVMIGYVHADKRYVAVWTDTYGAKFAGIGYGTRQGNSVEFRFDSPDGRFFNTFTWQPDKRQWTMRLESQDAGGGTRKLFAIDTLTRAQ
jgi:hypothetical protein